MSSKLEPAIWSHDTGQQIPCFDSCRLTITWMANIKDVPMVMVLLPNFSRYWTWHTDIQTVT